MPGIIENIFTSGKLLRGAKDIIDEIVTTKEEKIQLELRMRELFRQHEHDLMIAENDDRRSARDREVGILKVGALNVTQNILAYAGILAFFGMTGYIIAKGIGAMNTEESFIIGNLTGLSGAIAKDIYGYYFGSSKGERDATKRTVKQAASTNE